MDPPLVQSRSSRPSPARCSTPVACARCASSPRAAWRPGLKPGEALTVVVLLSECDDEAVASTAKTTLEKLPAPLLNGALAGDLPPGVLALVAPMYARNVAVMEKIVAHPAHPPADGCGRSPRWRARPWPSSWRPTSSECSRAPEIIEKLYMNKATRMSTADRVLELAVRNKIELKGIPAYKEAAIAIGKELVALPSIEPTPDDVLFDETEARREQGEGRSVGRGHPSARRGDGRRGRGREVPAAPRAPRHDDDLAEDPAGDARKRRRAAASRARFEPARRGRRDQEPEHPGERGRAHQRAAAPSPTTSFASSRWTASGRGRTRSS